ncbi:MAG: C40 family peptidase [Bacteroidota bacterium]|nr:C40 family peptidase [Bacteroidota bacterium]
MLNYLIFLVFSLFLLGFGAIADNNELKIANRVIESVSLKYAPDKRTALFDLVSGQISGQIILKGKTNMADAKRMVLDSLSMLGINVRDSVIVLPEPSLGEKTWAIATLAESSMRSEPDHAAELVSQALMGMPVKVLEKDGGWYRIQTPDQYLGWVDSRGIARKTDAEMALWKQSRRYVFNQTVGYVVATPKKNALHISDLVLNDLFEIVSEKRRYLQIIIPDGRTGFVKKADCISYQEWTNRKPDVEAILSVAKKLLGVPYLWGGTSCKGVDCSGMTKTAYYSQGIILARDASQQARYGEHPDFNEIPNLQPGDLLFFGRSAQRITHVGIHMGDGRYIHASGMVRINSIDPKAPDFNLSLRKNLVAASRILNSLNTEGIVLVKDHPWYH